MKRITSIPGLEPQMHPAVYWLAALAFVLRLVARLCEGIDAFWVNGYTFLFDFAQSIAAGNGIRDAYGAPETFRVPLYPILLAGLTHGHKAFWPIAITQSLMGAATAFCAALLARQMFVGVPGRAAATLAAATTALYPYYVMHDTAMQETSLFTLLTLIVIVLARPTARRGGLWLAALLGLLLGLDALTRVTILPFAVLVPFWLVLKRRIVPAMICGFLLALTVFPWLWRNSRITGALVMSTESGIQLWTGNNALLFRYYPLQSIDESTLANRAALSVSDRQELKEIGNNDAAVDRFFQQKALAYIRAHPWLTVANGFRKIGATFDWLPTPRRSLARTLMHAFSFGPMMTLGVWGMWRRRAEWREDLLIYLLFAEFLAITAIYFGQTSHRVYLDVYFIVFAAGALTSRFARDKAGQSSTEAVAS
jgi:hypothetical protein